MNLFTKGKKEHTDYIFNLYQYSGEKDMVSSGKQSHFKIIFIEEGSGVAKINKDRISFIAPCCFCVNEMDIIKILNRDNKNFFYIFFHPEIINSNFDFINIRNRNLKFSYSEIQVLYWLEPFISKIKNYGGYLCFGPSTAQRVKELNQSIGYDSLSTPLFVECL